MFNNKKFLIINSIYFICMLGVLGVFYLSYLGVIGDSNIVSTFLIQIVVLLSFSILLYTVFVSKNPKQTLKDFGFKAISFRVFIISVAIGVLLYIINIIVGSFFQTIVRMFGYETFSQAVSYTKSDLMWEFLLVAIIPGICEEVVHRGLVLGGIKRLGKPRLALILSSIFFGLCHMNIMQFFYTSILGCLMGIVVIQTDSIYPAMIMHFMNNFLSIYLNYGYKFGSKLSVVYNAILNAIYSMNIIGFLLVGLTVGIIAGYMYYWLFQRLKVIRTEEIARGTMKELNLVGLSMVQVQNKLNEVDSILNSLNTDILKNDFVDSKEKIPFEFKLTVLATVVLGGLMTISSFIWGVL